MNYMEKVVFCLALERQKGDYKVIDINDLVKSLGLPFGSITSEEWAIDTFTKMFTETELREAIKRGNMASQEYLNAPLKIISNEHHSLPIITKDDFEEYFKLRNSKEDITGHLKNKIFGLYKKIIEKKFTDESFVNGLLNKMKVALKSNQKNEVFNLIEMSGMDYHQIRPIYLAIMGEIKKEKEQKNILKLEKLNDVA